MSFPYHVISVVVPLVLAAALPASCSAAGVVRISPPVSVAHEIQLYSLTVPSMRPAATEKVVLMVPPGFTIGSFVPTPGWYREFAIRTTPDAVAEQVVWRGHADSDGDSLFQFLAEPMKPGSYTFRVEQTDSDGKIVNWSGPTDSRAPAPTIEVKNSLGGGGAVSALGLIALVVAVCGVIVAAIALITRGQRTLT